MNKEQLNDLIVKAQNGDAEAANAVVYEYRSLAKSVARSYYLIGADAEDVLQIGMLGLFKAVQTYKFDSNASFKTYATSCIRNIILDEIRKTKPSEMEFVPIDDVSDAVFPSDEKDPEYSFIEKESSEILYETISTVLNPMELDVFRLHLESLSYKEIAQQLGIERKKVDNTIYAVRKKLKKLSQTAEQKE